MIKATFFTGPFYLNNRQFDVLDKTSNRDNCLYGFYLLKKRFKENDVDLSTQDINLPSESQFIIYNEMPKVKDIFTEKDIYLIIFESEVIRSDNWNIENHKYFKKIFTWNDKYVDNKKYFKINFSHKIPNKVEFNIKNKKKLCTSHKIPNKVEFNIKNKKKLCTMIVANKFKSHPLELYTERIKTIRWFEENHPGDFDLYGIGWDKYYFKGILSRLNRFNVLRKILKPKYPSYKGPIKSKKEIYKKYKFAICYENARNIPGYITEKIFDCFFSGCVPVYWGAPNITDYIPEDTFIDRRNFKTYEKLYGYLNNISDKEYTSYLDAIKGFVQSDKIYPFSAEYFAETLSGEILKV